MANRGGGIWVVGNWAKLALKLSWTMAIVLRVFSWWTSFLFWSRVSECQPKAFHLVPQSYMVHGFIWGPWLLCSRAVSRSTRALGYDSPFWCSDMNLATANDLFCDHSFQNSNLMSNVDTFTFLAIALRTLVCCLRLSGEPQQTWWYISQTQTKCILIWKLELVFVCGEIVPCANNPGQQRVTRWYDHVGHLIIPAEPHTIIRVFSVYNNTVYDQKKVTRANVNILKSHGDSLATAGRSNI